MIDDIKKENIIYLFKHYINVINTNKKYINEQVTHTTAFDMVVLCHEAIDDYDKYFDLDGDNSKVNRWLGYIQGVLITIRLLDVQTERDMTRPYLTKHRPAILDKRVSDSLEQLNKVVTGDEHNYFDTWTTDSAMEMKDMFNMSLKNEYTLDNWELPKSERLTTSKMLENPKVSNVVLSFMEQLMKEIKDKTHVEKQIGSFSMYENTKTIVGSDENGNLIVTPIDASAVLIKRGDKFLGVSRKDDHTNIGLPSGKRDPGESFEQCAIRETLEETGYTIRLIDVQPFAMVDEDSNIYCRTFLAEIVNTPRQPLSPEETAIYGFFDKQDFIDGSFGSYNVKMFKHFRC